MGIRSFRGRVFLALLAIGIIPSMVILGGAALAFRQAVDVSGTAGPWSAVAESGSDLFERIEEAGPLDPALEAAVASHEEALQTSVRYSDLYAALARRVSGSLPLFVFGFFAVVALASLAAARGLSRGLAAPISELVEWTGTIARGDPLPPEGQGSPTGGAPEFGRLRTALRGMADELDEGRRRAVESARLRSWTEVARRVAHEIKNPLTPIQISAAALARDPRPNVVEASTIILEEVKRLDELARSFAQLGRLPEGPGAPVDIVELLQGLAARHSGPELSIGVDAEGTIPLVPGHHEALVRVFRNLIGNAGEAMGRGAVDAQDAGTPHIEAQVTLTPGGVVVRVMDRGPGFSEEALEALWDPEFTTKLGGTGIGLSLVKGTIEAHGGSVVADNREGGGACVTVTLPVRGEED